MHFKNFTECGNKAASVHVTSPAPSAVFFFSSPSVFPLSNFFPESFLDAMTHIYPQNKKQKQKRNKKEQVGKGRGEGEEGSSPNDLTNCRENKMSKMPKQV